MSHLQEIREEPQPHRAAALGVELRTQDPPPSRHGGEFAAVGAAGEAELVRHPFGGVAVDEIDVTIFQTLQQRMAGRAVQAVPSDVGDRHGLRQAGDAAGEEAEAVGHAEFLSFVKEDLEADADAEQRGPAVERLAQRLLQRAAQPVARWREGADAGEDQAAGRRHLPGVGGDRDPGADVLEGAREVAQVAHSGVDHQGLVAHTERVPLVLGTSADPIRFATAWRSASAAALKAASAAWWPLRAARMSRWRVSRPRSANAWKKSATRVSGKSAVTQLAATSRGAA